VRISDGKSRGEMRLARAIEGLPVRGEKNHSCPGVLKIRDLATYRPKSVPTA